MSQYRYRIACLRMNYFLSLLGDRIDAHGIKLKGCSYHPSGSGLGNLPNIGRLMVSEDLLKNQIRQIKECSSPEQLNQQLYKITQMCGFDYYQFGLLIPSGLLQSFVTVLSHTPKDWSEHCWQSHIATHDPLVILSLKQSQPIIWSELSWLDGSLPEQGQAIMRQRAEHGMREGVTLPIHSPQGHHAMLHLSREKPTGEVFSSITCLSVVYPYVFQRACELLSPPNPNLSERERECLFWVSEGKTSWEAAKILGITERTVNFHLNSAIRKTGCKNRYQAIARNIAAGQLKPDLDRLSLSRLIKY